MILRARQVPLTGILCSRCREAHSPSSRLLKIMHAYTRVTASHSVGSASRGDEKGERLSLSCAVGVWRRSAPESEHELIGRHWPLAGFPAP